MSDMYFPSEKEFLKLSNKGNLIPVFSEISSDLETPVSAFLKLADDSKYSCLLESVEGQEKIARYSFIAYEPSTVITIKRKRLEILTRDKAGLFKKKKSKILGSPLNEIRAFMSKYKFIKVKGSPRFCGGLVGYLGYDMVRFFESLPAKNRQLDDMADAMLLFADTLLVFDHLNHKLKIVACAYIKNRTPKDASSAYRRAVNRINKIITTLKKPLKENRPLPGSSHQKINAAISKKKFIHAVLKAKRYIKKGDIIQVVFSQVLSTPISKRPFDIYRRLRGLNPSAYMFYLRLGSLRLVGSSPEMLVRCEDGIVTTRPIAGTRPRGSTEAEDEKLGRELLKDAKERAEHIMLVDLGRNDLGRVCEFATVKVSEFMRIERYSHVMHIVSEVKGKLGKNKDAYDVLRAAFPAGTVTGSPKVRAMEIIEELESCRRGPYAGAVGYFSFSGNMDTCITIRTIVVNRNTAYVQAGAGIVADSQPAKEYQETLNKAKAQIEAL